MRLEVKCTACQASVLVLDVDPAPDNAGTPDPSDVVRKVKAAGWTLNQRGAVCTDH